MKRWIVFLIAAGSLGSVQPGAFAGDCQTLAEELRLPVKVKAAGKPRMAKWGDVEKTMTAVREGLKGRACQFTFGQVFALNKPDAFFPLLGNVLRTAPEDSLAGVAVFTRDGYSMGRFSNRVTFVKRGEYNYTDYYFQFEDSQGKLQSGGNNGLLDIAKGEPVFMVKWDEIENRVAASSP